VFDSVEEFVRLRLSENIDEYSRAAWEEAPLEIWLEVIEKYPDMRFWVAQNKTIPLEVLEILSDDSDCRVRHMIASKNKTPEHIQMKLATDSDPSVRQRIAYNKKATMAALQILAHDEDQEIKQQAQRRLARFK
jgi:hypothetical protein